MSYAWERTHRRYRLVHAVLDDVAEAGRPVLSAGRLAEIEAEYGGLDGFLQDVQLRWYRMLEARLDTMLERRAKGRSGDDGDAVRGLWQRLAAEQWPMRLLLDAFADHPAVLAGEAHRGARLAPATASCGGEPCAVARPSVAPAGR